jgi:DNA polymerase III subunit delta'
MAFTAERAYEHIANAHEHGRLAHALLISGVKDSGKEALAAKVAWLLQGKANAGTDLFGDAVISEPLPLDEQENDAVQVVRPEKNSRVINVDRIREVEQRLHMVSGKNVWKIVVLLEADRMNTQAQNAFLKTLEEPPNSTILLLLTSQPQKLLPTILSRCVQLPLLGKADYKSNGGDELVKTLNRVASESFGTPWGALTIKAAFTEVLDRRKTELEKQEDEIYNAEKKHYAQTTDGRWLKEREETHKAAARSAYIGERSRYFDVLMAWMADALRCQNGCPCEDFPEVASLIAKISDKETTTSLLKRVEALEELRATLETNASEQLAIECGFLQAFG